MPRHRKLPQNKATIKTYRTKIDGNAGCNKLLYNVLLGKNSCFSTANESAQCLLFQKTVHVWRAKNARKKNDQDSNRKRPEKSVMFRKGCKNLHEGNMPKQTKNRTDGLLFFAESHSHWVTSMIIFTDDWLYLVNRHSMSIYWAGQLYRIESTWTLAISIVIKFWQMMSYCNRETKTNILPHCIILSYWKWLARRADGLLCLSLQFIQQTSCWIQLSLAFTAASTSDGKLERKCERLTSVEQDEKNMG